MKIFILTVCLLLLGLYNGLAFAENDQCDGLINSRCQVCHYKARICQALGTKSPREWKSTVTHMIRLGAKLSDAEKNTLIACLGSAPVGADFVCKN